MTTGARLRRWTLGGSALLVATAVGYGTSAPAAAKSSAPVVVWSESRTGLVPVDNAVDAAMTRAFDRAHPGYRLELSRLPAATFRTKDFAALEANKPIDVFKMDNADLATYFYNGAITPINAYLHKWSHHLRMNLFTTTAIHGKILGVPDNTYALGLVVRRDWLRKYHLPQPTTWATFLEDAKVFKAHGHIGFAESYQIKNGAFGWQYETWLYAAGAPSFVPQAHGTGWTPTFQGAAGVATARFLRTLQRDAVISSDAATLPWPETYTQFTSGQAGMVIAANNIIPAIQQAGLKGKVEVVPIPHPARPYGKPTALAGGSFYFLNSHAPNRAGGLAFLRWLLSRPVQVKQVTGSWAPGDVPIEMSARTDVNAAALRGNNPLDLGFQAILEGPVRQEPAFANYLEAKTDLSKALVNIMLQHAAAAATLKATARQLAVLAK